MGAPVVTLVNPNMVHPPITPYALDILTTTLEAGGFIVDVVDLTFHRDDWRTAIRDYFTTHAPLLVGVTIRNTDTIYPQEQRVFIDDHRNVIAAIKQYTPAPIVAGGVGFSSMPFALVDYFNIPYGVKGPGENTLLRLASALAAGQPADTVPGLLINHGGGHITQVPIVAGGSPRSPRSLGLDLHSVNTTTPYTRRSGVAGKVDNLAYYRRGGLGNILTKNGCTFACAHCVEPDAKGALFSRRDVHAVVDELEALTAQGVYDVHTTDSEFNLLIAHAKNVLAEIVRRKHRDPGSPLHRLLLWIYTQPAPFDDELMDLLAAAGCGGINVAPDHVRDDLLDGWKTTARGTRYYTYDDVVTLCSLARKHQVPVMTEVMLGMPGETADTMRECVQRTLELDSTVVGYTLGIRLFPYSPLGVRLAKQSGGHQTVRGLQSNTAVDPIVLTPADACTTVDYERQFLLDRHGRLRPVFYFSPDLPEDPETLDTPNGRWTNSVNLLREFVPASEHYRVMLPTEPGLTPDDNNYADNPFLLRLSQIGYTGAYWSHWPHRHHIMTANGD